MEVDPSSRTRQTTNSYKGYRGNAPSNRQKVNITTQEQEHTGDYNKHAQDNIGEFEGDLLPTEDCNFLEGSPCSRM